MKSKPSKTAVVLSVVKQEMQLLREKIGFEWPLREGRASFCAETNTHPCDGRLWEQGIRISIFKAPTIKDIQHDRFTSGRFRAQVETFKFRVSKRGTRTGSSTSYKETCFQQNDPSPPCELIAILIEQVDRYNGWKRVL